MSSHRWDPKIVADLCDALRRLQHEQQAAPPHITTVTYERKDDDDDWQDIDLHFPPVLRDCLGCGVMPAPPPPHCYHIVVLYPDGTRR